MLYKKNHVTINFAFLFIIFCVTFLSSILLKVKYSKLFRKCCRELSACRIQCNYGSIFPSRGNRNFTNSFSNTENLALHLWHLSHDTLNNLPNVSCKFLSLLRQWMGPKLARKRQLIDLNGRVSPRKALSHGVAQDCELQRGHTHSHWCPWHLAQHELASSALENCD